ncbi:hypothetical protein C4553_02035 [Candidatus Parcubacteria bacterium]|nr:MAG: hypothetical protein C4553_02035 [Candidatus Parcubacteria bacterium]
MITINLLPPEKKKDYRTELNRRLIVFYSVGLLVVLGIFVSLLLSINLYLSIESGTLNEEIATLESLPRNKELRKLELTLRDLSATLANTSAVKKELSPIHGFFNDLAAARPTGVYLLSFSFDRQQLKASLRGFAPTRNEVIRFKENLEKVGWVAGVESPLSNVIRERDINFDFSIDLKGL